METSALSQFMNFLLNHHYVMAVGVALTAFVGGTRLLMKSWIPWFGTKIGGYVWAYFCAFALYLGTAFTSGTTVDAQLLLSALSSALMASGILDHWRDLFSVPPKTKAAIASVAAMIFVVTACSDCAGTTPTGGTVITSVVNCAAPGGDLEARIKDEALRMAAIAFGPDLNKWSEIETLAVNDGLTVGGCAFSQIVNDWITKKSLATASATSEINEAKSVFENYRARYAGGATFHQDSGDM